MPLVTPSSVPTSSLPLPDPADLSTWPARMKELHRWMRNDAAPSITALGDASYQNALHAETMAANASGTANFKGNWSSLTGALNTPASVYHNSKFWLLLANLANVTTATPGVSSSWLDITNILTGVQTAAGARSVLGVPAYTDIRPAIAPIAAPTLVLPADASSSDGTSFSVSAFSHAENVATYGLQIQRATNAGFTTEVEYSTVTQDSSATRAMAASTVGQVRYWRARWVVGSQVGDWSASRSYTGADPFVFVGRVHQQTAALSVTGTAVGDLLICAWGHTGTPPASPSGFSTSNVFSGGAYANMAYATKIATSVNESVSHPSSTYGAALYVVRGVTGIIGSAAVTSWAVGVANATLNLPTGASGNPNIIIGFDSSNASTWTGPAAWNSGSGAFLSTAGTNMVIGGGYSSSAVSGQTVSRITNPWNGAVMLSLRMK